MHLDNAGLLNQPKPVRWRRVGTGALTPSVTPHVAVRQDERTASYAEEQTSYRAGSAARTESWNLGSGLPQTQHVALGVLEVGECAHTGDRGPRRDGGTALRFDLLERIVDAIDVDGDHR